MPRRLIKKGDCYCPLKETLEGKVKLKVKLKQKNAKISYLLSDYGLYKDKYCLSSYRHQKYLTDLDISYYRGLNIKK